MVEFTFTKIDPAELLGTCYQVHFHPTKSTFRSERSGTYIGRVKKINGGWEGILPGKHSASTWRTGGAARLHAAESLAYQLELLDGDYHAINLIV